MNLYDLHSNPKELHGFNIAPYKIPELAYFLAKRNPALIPELEPAMMKDPCWACIYATNILKRRWLEAEPAIAKDPQWAYYYAKFVLKRPWPEAEPYIMKDLNFWKNYKRHFKL